MTDFAAGLYVGAVSGACAGIFIASILFAARSAERAAEHHREREDDA